MLLIVISVLVPVRDTPVPAVTVISVPVLLAIVNGEEVPLTLKSVVPEPVAAMLVAEFFQQQASVMTTGAENRPDQSIRGRIAATQR